MAYIMDANTLYSYDPIRHDELRLVKFIHDGRRISAVLDIFPVEGPVPQYHALSYTWASDERVPTRSWAIEIKKKQLPVLDSLQLFVQALMSKGILVDGTWWWIDSICIDQTNIEERDQQVQLMKRIYGNAHKVIIWLGEGSNDSDLAIDFIQLLDETSRENYSDEEIRILRQKDEYNSQWIALGNFFLRKWWTRIWTIQEFVLASSVSFWCGVRTISRSAVCGALWVSDRCSSVGFKTTPAFQRGFNRRRAWLVYEVGRKSGNDFNLSLLALAAYFSNNEATDGRDRLYGLRALSTDGLHLDVDYSLTVEEVYLRFTQSFIARHKSLDIICFASRYSAPSGSLQPSWVPDWRKGTELELLVIPSMVSQSSNTKIGNFRPPRTLEYRDTSICYSASKDRAAVYEFQGSALLARGAIIDTVDGLAGSKNSKLVQSSESNYTQLPGFSDVIYSPTDILTSVCKSLVLGRKDRYLRYVMPTEKFFHDFICLCAPLITESTPAAPKEFEEWLNWTRPLRIHGHSFESILRDSHQVDSSSSNSNPNQDEYIPETFYNRFFDTIVRMSLRLMVSRNGRVGMVPEKAMKGDLVCVLFGCSVPVLLRKVEQGDNFTFIGECFLDGCMEGEALEQRDLLERTFCIR